MRRIWALFLLLIAALPVHAEKVTVFADFEHGLGDWTTGGDAFGVSAAGDQWGRQGHGGWFADSRHFGEQKTGTLRSPEFRCPDEIRFLANGWDRRDGSGGRNFYRLRLNDGTLIRESKPPLTTGKFVEMRWHVSQFKGRRVRIEVVDGASDGAFAWLAIDDVRLVDLGPLVPASRSDLYAVGATSAATQVEAAGVTIALWNKPPVYENSTYTIPVGCAVSEIYLLGHISTYDRGCPPWGEHTDFTRDFSRQQMIDDRAGEIRIEYTDGTAEVIPLIFGFTMWWNEPWRNNREPISSDAAARRAFNQSCHLKEVTLDDGSLRFLSAIACDNNKPVRRIVFIDGKQKAGCPAFWGITVRTNHPAAGLLPLGHHLDQDGWLATHRITPSVIRPAVYLPALHALQSAVGVRLADVPAHLAVNIPADFAGPKFRLSGGVVGDILTNAYYATVQSAATKSIRGDGYIYCAPPNMPDYNAYDSISTYQVISRGASSSWTRGYEYLRDLAAWGYVKEVTRAIDWADSQLWYYPQECPLRYEKDGKQLPWPAHWATMADHPPAGLQPGHNEIPGDENDGHAITMMMRYAAWQATGNNLAWLRARWKPAVAAANWLCFVLDYTGQDALYNESEGTCYGTGFDPKATHPYDTYPYYDIFTNTGGREALLQSASMAEALGDTADASKWKRYAARIERGIQHRCVVHDPIYGDVWRVHPNSVWPQFDERLAPIFELPYCLGLDSTVLDAETRRICRNSLRMQIGCPPDYEHGLGLGYGQAWITAAALLLDEMKTAQPLLRNLALDLYFPRQPYPFISTEGVVVNENGDFRVRNGTVGIDEGLFVTRVFRVLMGIDNPAKGFVQIMPRLPIGFPSVTVQDYPVSTTRDGRTVRTLLSYTYRIQPDRITLHVSVGDPLNCIRVRFGPFAHRPVHPLLKVGRRLQRSYCVGRGDSWWVWADVGYRVREVDCRLITEG